MADPRKAVDGVLGAGWYDEWQDLEAEIATETRAARLNEARFSHLREPGTTDRLWWDLRLLEGIASDYRAALSAIVQQQTTDRVRVGHIHDALTLALGVVHHDNEALDAAFAAGLLAGFVAMPFAVLQARATRLARLLDLLEERLQAAKRERNEAWVQTALNTSITVVTALVPHVSLVARGGILLGQWLLDDALGPSTSTAATAGSKANLVASQLAPSSRGAPGDLGKAVWEIDGVGNKTRTVAKRASGVTTVIGFAFDVNEVMVGYENIDQLERAMARAKKAYESLRAEIRKNKQVLEKFLMNYERWQVAIQSIRENGDAIRAALREELLRTGYAPPK